MDDAQEAADENLQSVESEQVNSVYEEGKSFLEHLLRLEQSPLAIVSFYVLFWMQLCLESSDCLVLDLSF